MPPWRWRSFGRVRGRLLFFLFLNLNSLCVTLTLSIRDLMFTFDFNVAFLLLYP